MHTLRSYSLILVVVSALSVSSQTAAQSTGDAVIDGWLSGYSVKAGNNTTPARLSLGNYPFFNACNSGSPPGENNCPSDIAYSPGHNGGYQAFGAGLTNYPELLYWVEDCSYEDVWVWDNETGNWVLEWQYICDYYQVHLQAQTSGRLGARIKWSTTPVGTLIGNRPLGTVALKAQLDHPPGYDDWECDPSYTYGFGSSAPCAPGKQNAYIVPAGYSADAGYEDKIVIPEATCNAFPYRQDDYSDFYNQCFMVGPTGWWSDLPAAYRDTNKFDPTANFVAGVGTASPAAIIEGHVYGWWAYFGSAGNEALLGPPPVNASHRASITVEQSSHPLCDGLPKNCQFQVDQTAFNDAPFHP